MKLENLIPALIIGIAIVITAVIFQTKRADLRQKGMVQLTAHGGALYKIHTATGQTKVLVPADNAVGFVDVPDINFENQEAMKENLKAVSQYVRSERARDLAAQGLKEALLPPPAKSETTSRE